MYDQEAIRSSITKLLYTIVFVTAFCGIVYAAHRQEQSLVKDLSTLINQVLVFKAFESSHEVTGDEEAINSAMLGEFVYNIGDFREGSASLTASLRPARIGSISPLGTARPCNLLFLKVEEGEWFTGAALRSAEWTNYLILPSTGCEARTLPIHLLETRGVYGKYLTLPAKDGGRFFPCTNAVCGPFATGNLHEDVEKLAYALSVRRLGSRIDDRLFPTGQLHITLSETAVRRVVESLFPRERFFDDVPALRAEALSLIRESSGPATFSLAGLTLSKGALFLVSVALIFMSSQLLDFELSRMGERARDKNIRPWIMTDAVATPHRIIALALSASPLLGLATLFAILVDYFGLGFIIFEHAVILNPLRAQFSVERILFGWPQADWWARAILTMLFLFAAVALFMSARTSYGLLTLAVGGGVGETEEPGSTPVQEKEF